MQSPLLLHAIARVLLRSPRLQLCAMRWDAFCVRKPKPRKPSTTAEKRDSFGKNTTIFAHARTDGSPGMISHLGRAETR
eukprot:4935303-Prymnesium_polylepis.2